MKKIRSICMFLLLLVSMLSLPLLVRADASTDVVFEQVEVNGVDVTDDGSVGITRGDDVEIRVELSSPNDYDHVSLEASVVGYKYDYIEDRTYVGLTPGVKYAYLHLELPNDMEAGDYDLHLYVDGKTGSHFPSIVLQVEKEVDNLAIKDVILRPTSTVEAGRPLAVEVRVENMGKNKQEDIRVSVSIKDLGVSTRAYLDELGDVEDSPEADETTDSVTLYLPIPVDAVNGEYDLDVDVEYDRGHEVVSTKTKVYVRGTTAAKTEVNTIISIDAVSKSVVKGGLVMYRLMLANLGDSEAVYSLTVQGTESWADVSLSPGFVRVAPNNAGELTLTVKPKDVATAGDHSFTLRVRQGEKILRDITLDMSVSEARSNLLGVKSVLEIGFAVLVSLLVILGLVVAFKKLGKRRGNEPEPIMDNGQSYY